MVKLPYTIRFFRKPDHISFLIGLPLLIATTITGIFEIKIACILFFSFTISYEVYEISKGNRQIFKLDHITFVIAFILLVISIWEEQQILLIISSILVGFTLSYEIYSVRKKDIENKRKRMSK